MVIKIAIRSVGIRRLFSGSGAARRGDRRRAHGADDPPLSRLMAPDDRGDDLDPAMLTSLVVLYFLGETINTMTLGGLALAVGILVDDSTVTIENTYRLLDEEKMSLPKATLHGAAEIAVPTLVSTLAISCVFTSVIFLEGPAKYLFTPRGLAVVFAMLASYGLSRTLTPITIGLLLKGEGRGAEGGWFARFHHHLERGFDRLRDGYAELLATLLTRRILVPIAAIATLALGTVMYLFVGRDFFPVIDGGQIQLHVRAP